MYNVGNALMNRKEAKERRGLNAMIPIPGSLRCKYHHDFCSMTNKPWGGQKDETEASPPLT